MRLESAESITTKLLAAERLAAELLATERLSSTQALLLLGLLLLLLEGVEAQCGLHQDFGALLGLEALLGELGGFLLQLSL